MSGKRALSGRPPRWAVHRRLYEWVMGWAEHPQAAAALFLLAAAEASVFPVPPDVLLIALALGAPQRARRFALICTTGSVLGGVVGYGIGWGFWHVTASWFFHYLAPVGFTPENFDKVQVLYQRHAFLAVLTAGFTPIPFKVFTIAAGVFKIGFGTFVAAALLGRAGRFFLVAEGIRWIGPPVRPFLERHLGWLTLLLGGLVVLGFYAVKLL